MKKSLIIALAMVAPVMAGDEKSAPIAEYVDVPTPTQQPAVQSAWGIEVAGTYSDYDLKYDYYYGTETETFDLYGGSLTAVYNASDSVAITLRASYAEGDWSESSLIEMTNYTITAGVRMTSPITESLSWYLGVEMGYINTELSALGYEFGSDDGFIASAEVGLKYNVTESVYVFGSIGVSGVIYSSSSDEDYEDADVYATSVNASIGVGCKF